jgi:hypothetical protein
MTMQELENVVTVSRRIHAPASAAFGVLCDPSRHVSIDGADMLRSADPRRLTGVGDSFAVEMWNDEMGRYQMTNTIVAFEADQVIAWEPVMTRASRPEDQPTVGMPALHRWCYELSAVDDTTTDVAETFDCSRSPEWLQQVLRGGQRWVAAMTATLDRLAEAVA